MTDRKSRYENQEIKKLTPEKLSIKSARIRRAREIIKPILKRAAESRRKILKGTEDASEPTTPAPPRSYSKATATKERKNPETETAGQSDADLRPTEDCTGVDSKTLSKETSQEFSSGNFQHDAQKFYKAILSDIFLE